MRRGYEAEIADENIPPPIRQHLTSFRQTLQAISDKYLESILKSLVKQKMLKGLRGKGGGYQLTRTPAEYSVGEILEVAEGTLAPVACLMDDAEDCPRANQCRTLPMWKKFDSMVHDFFYGITLEDILDNPEFLPEE